MTVARVRANQIAGFVTVPSWRKKHETCYHNQNIFVEERRHTILLELIPLLIREARNTSQNICEYITKHFISAISQLT